MRGILIIGGEGLAAITALAHMHLHDTEVIHITGEQYYRMQMAKNRLFIPEVQPELDDFGHVLNEFVPDRSLEISQIALEAMPKLEDYYPLVEWSEKKDHVPAGKLPFKKMQRQITGSRAKVEQQKRLRYIRRF